MAKIKRAPMQRQFLGEYTVRYEGEMRQVRVYVNPADVAYQLAQRAIRSKTQRARAIFGAVLVEDVTPIPGGLRRPQ